MLTQTHNKIVLSAILFKNKLVVIFTLLLVYNLNVIYFLRSIWIPTSLDIYYKLAYIVIDLDLYEF